MKMYSRYFAGGSTSPPGGNQVDGLPPVDTLTAVAFGALVHAVVARARWPGGGALGRSWLGLSQYFPEFM